jgi:hypothetical protein
MGVTGETLSFPWPQYTLPVFCCAALFALAAKL